MMIDSASWMPGHAKQNPRVPQRLRSHPAAQRRDKGVLKPPIIAVIDGPFQAHTLSRIFARAPIRLRDQGCAAEPSAACGHGTFIMGLLGARQDAQIPGLCPDCELIHVPLFADKSSAQTTVAELAGAISASLRFGARLINLSLAILGDDAEHHSNLADALDQARSCGAIVVAAAGNEGRVAMGQIMRHPASIPVAAVDRNGELLPDSNFGPAISLRGVSAIGKDVWGYAAGGQLTAMSGTSIATTVVTGILARAWSANPEFQARDLLAAVNRLKPRGGKVPPLLTLGLLLAELQRNDPTRTISLQAAKGDQCFNHIQRQGGTTMTVETGSGASLGPRLAAGEPLGKATVAPAQLMGGGCACGGMPGACTCGNGDSSASHFIYALGGIDIRFPDPSISHELQTVAGALKQGPNENLRDWCHRVLKQPHARYVARQICWVVTIKCMPAYYLALRDLNDLGDLIDCLSRPLDEDLCLFVGRSSLLPVEASTGVRVPVLNTEQLSWFKKPDIIKWFGAPPQQAPTFDPEELYRRLFHMCANLGDEDKSRAINYLAVRYKPLHKKCAEMAIRDYRLNYFDVVESRLTARSERRVLDVVFTFTNDSGGHEDYFVREDLSYLFPILVDNDLAEYSKMPRI